MVPNYTLLLLKTLRLMSKGNDFWKIATLEWEKGLTVVVEGHCCCCRLDESNPILIVNSKQLQGFFSTTVRSALILCGEAEKRGQKPNCFFTHTLYMYTRVFPISPHIPRLCKFCVCV